MRLLLVEDEVRIAAFLAKGLRNAGHVVDCVETGSQALAQLTCRPLCYDAVLLDLGLPDIDGLEVLQWIRARAMAVTVVIVTARGDDQDRARGYEFGADDYLIKPFSVQDLLARLHRVAGRAETSRP